MLWIHALTIAALCAVAIACTVDEDCVVNGFPVCHEGTCVECVSNGNCGMGLAECLVPTCVLPAHTCDDAQHAADGTSCFDNGSGTPGACADGVCVPCNAETCTIANHFCLDGACVECDSDFDCVRYAVCDAGTCDLPTHTCNVAYAADTTPCNVRDTGENGTCSAGDCIPCNAETCDLNTRFCFGGACVQCLSDDDCLVSFVECDAGTCNQQTHTCNVTTHAADGTRCLVIGDAGDGACDDGVCVPCNAGTCACLSDGNCSSPDACHVGVCNQETTTCELENSADGVLCGNDGHCLSGDCVGCISDGDCIVSLVECFVLSCNQQSHTCNNTAHAPDGTRCEVLGEGGDGQCEIGVCVPCNTGTCACLSDGNCSSPDACHVGVCNQETTTCELENVPDDTACDDGAGRCGSGECIPCNGGVCVDCVDPDADCSPMPCHTPVCVNGSCVLEWDCRPDQCVSDECVACGNATLDCDQVDSECGVAYCDEDHACAAADVSVNRSCSTDDIDGFCGASGACLQCLEDGQCASQANCTAACTNGTCVYECGPGCVHAVGWWYRNAETAFPALAPVFIGGSTINVSDYAVLRAYIRRGYGSNGLDTLASMLLVAKLNIALSAALPIGLVGSMDMADDILAVCPPNNRTVWREILRTSECHGYYATSFQPLIASLLSFSNGRSDAPLCTDIGKHRP